jgi:hypothetical protein
MANRKEPEEIWKDIKHHHFKNLYEISNLGRLRTKPRLVTRGGESNRYTYLKAPRIVVVRRGEYPHLFASLYSDDPANRNKTAYVHKLVAEVFIKRPSSKHIFVTHINNNYEDNKATNLKWITASENSKSNIEKYPENALTLKTHNEKVGYYDMLKSKAWDNKNIKRIVKMRKWGVNVIEIARIYSCSTATVYNILKKN